MPSPLTVTLNNLARLYEFPKKENQPWSGSTRPAGSTQGSTFPFPYRSHPVVYRSFSIYSTSMLLQRSLYLADWFAFSGARSSPRIAERHTILRTVWGDTPSQMPCLGVGNAQHC
jgi:hypothetical protein